MKTLLIVLVLGALISFGSVMLFGWLMFKFHMWCSFPRCDCNLNAGEQKCLRRVDSSTERKS